MLKKSLFLALLLGCFTHLKAQDAVLKAGTPVHLTATKTVLAREANVGDVVPFRVTSDVVESGRTLVPAGSMVIGKVVEAKKSTVLGTKGRLRININLLTLPSGQQIFFNHDIAFYGQNRTPIAVISGLFLWPLLLIPGSKAYMPEGYTTVAQVMSNTTLQ